MKKALVSKKFTIEKTHGKGGWSFVSIPGLKPKQKVSFGMIKVSGFIDDMEVKNFRIWHLKNGNTFLPLKEAIRKKIKKQAGDTVKILLYEDDWVLEVPEDFQLCLQDDPEVNIIFNALTEGQRKGFVDWINDAKTDKTRVDRIVKTMEKLRKGEKYPSTSMFGKS